MWMTYMPFNRVSLHRSLYIWISLLKSLYGRFGFNAESLLSPTLEAMYTIKDTNILALGDDKTYVT